MSKGNLLNKVKVLGHLSRMEKMRMNEWMLEKAEILQKIKSIDDALEELENKIKAEIQFLGEEIVSMENYALYIKKKRNEYNSQKQPLIKKLDQAQENLSQYFTQHKTYENLQKRNSENLEFLEKKEQKDILDDIATLGYVKKTKKSMF